MNRSHTIARHAATLLLAGAVAAPVAAARTDLGAPAPHRSPASVDLRSPDARDAAAGRPMNATSTGRGYHYVGSTLVPIGSAPRAAGVRIVRVSDHGGFDWADAGIGGAGGLALALVAFSVTVVVRDRNGARRRLRPAPGTPRS